MVAHQPIDLPVGWEGFTTGSRQYVADVAAAFDRVLVAGILRSTEAHAGIARIDFGEASALPGVAAIATGELFADRTYTHHGAPLSDRPPLALDRVRFVGEEVLAIAAESERELSDALGKVRVSYRRKKPILSLAKGLARGGQAIHDREKKGISLELVRHFGSQNGLVDGISVESEYEFPRQAHAVMEPAGTLAVWHPVDETFEVWTSTQAPLLVRAELASLLEVSPEKIMLREVAVGGGFGARSRIAEHEVVACALARLAGEPVFLSLSREEEFAATKTRHKTHIRLRTERSADGSGIFRKAQIRMDNGAYNHSGPSVLANACNNIVGPYNLTGVSVNGQLIDTNHQPGGQFRGYGAPQAFFATESGMDELADKLGIDPIDLRLKHLIQSDSTSLAGLRIGTCEIERCLEEVRKRLDWDARRQLGGTGRGVGVALAMHGSGSNAFEGASRSRVRLSVFKDGTIEVRFGGSDPGTGQRNVLARIVGGSLGVSSERISVVLMDTAETPEDHGSWSSRGAYMAANTAEGAAQELRRELLEGAATILSDDTDQLRLGEGGISNRAGKVVSFGELVQLLAPRQQQIVVERQIDTGADPTDLMDGGTSPSPAYSFAAHGVAVEVDKRTGHIEIVQYVAVHDSGTIIDEEGARGQVIGGVAMGLGAALREEIVHEGGRVANPAYIDYALFRAPDMPDVEVAFVGKESKGAQGVKGLGEISIDPVAPAVANAVSHACGARIRSLPLTPDKVLSALNVASVTDRNIAPIWKRPGRWWIALIRWLYPRGLHTLLHHFASRHPVRPAAPPEFRLEFPADLIEASAALEQPESAAIAGGTDLLVAHRENRRNESVLIDLTSLPSLTKISREGSLGSLQIGAMASLSDVETSSIIPQSTAIRETLQGIASPQIRRMATVGGNLCQEKRCWFYRHGFDCYKRSGPTRPCYAILGDHRFYHASIGAHRCQAVTPSDLATTLLALDATVEVASGAGRRSIDVGNLYVGPGEVALDSSEIVTSVTIPSEALARTTSYRKMRLWSGDFAVVNASVSLASNGNAIQDARVALGAVSNTPMRLKDVERWLTRAGSLDSSKLPVAARQWLHDAHPLPGNQWKIEAARALLQDAILDAWRVVDSD